MAAGLGFKTFTTGEVLTAANVNGYLMQGVLVFASTAARDAAITSPQEGQFAYTKDTNGLWYYDGAVWVASGATGDIEGVTAGVGISGGGTSGTVTITNSMATAIDAKGDLVAGTGADAFSKLTVGANGTLLTADSAEATGLKWAAASAAASTFTLINSGGTALSSTSTTISSLGGYNQYFFYLLNPGTTSSGNKIKVQFNSDTTTKYNYIFTNCNPVTGFSSMFESYTNSSIETATRTTSGSYSLQGTITGANGTGTKVGRVQSVGAGDQNDTNRTLDYFYTGAAAITSITFAMSSGSFSQGTAYIYGAN